MDDDDVLVNYFSEDVIDQLFNQHTASAYSHDQTYLFLETLGLTSFFHVFITANIPFFKVLRLNETELRNLNVQPFDVRQRVINASQQCLAKYEFSPPFYPETSPYPKHKTASSRFFKEPAPETLPLSGATNSSHASHPSP